MINFTQCTEWGPRPLLNRFRARLRLEQCSALVSVEWARQRRPNKMEMRMAWEKNACSRPSCFTCTELAGPHVAPSVTRDRETKSELHSRSTLARWLSNFLAGLSVDYQDMLEIQTQHLEQDKTLHRKETLENGRQKKVRKSNKYKERRKETNVISYQ